MVDDSGYDSCEADVHDTDQQGHLPAIRFFEDDRIIYQSFLKPCATGQLPWTSKQNEPIRTNTECPALREEAVAENIKRVAALSVGFSHQKVCSKINSPGELISHFLLGGRGAVRCGASTIRRQYLARGILSI